MGIGRHHSRRRPRVRPDPHTPKTERLVVDPARQQRSPLGIAAPDDGAGRAALPAIAAVVLSALAAP